MLFTIILITLATKIDTSTHEEITMKNAQLQYPEDKINIEQIKKMATDSSKRIRKDRDKCLKQAIKEQDIIYLSRELSNVSTSELLKVLAQRFIHKYIHLN